jgi:hypothetical protein
VAHPPHRATNKRRHQFVPINDSIDPDIAQRATLQYAEENPDHAHEGSQIARSVADRILTPDMFCVADQSVLERIKDYAPHLSQFKWMQSRFYAIMF